MTIRQIDILVPSNPSASQYGVLFHFSRKMHEAFEAIGVKSRVLDARDPAFLSQLHNDPPDYTFAFNGIQPNKKGVFFCDELHIPHIAYLLDSPLKFLPMICSRYLILTCADRCAVDLFKNLGCKRVLFMPHAVEASLGAEKPEPPIYDAVMLASFIDCRKCRETWKSKYPLLACQLLEKAAEESLIDSGQPFYKIFTSLLLEGDYASALNDAPPFAIANMLGDLEFYMRGKERLELLQGIQKTRIDVFGSGWEKYAEHYPHVEVHAPVAFEQALKIMKQSKIILNSCPSFRQGGHERIFAGLVCGGLVITNDNLYLREQFQEDISIAFYRYPEWESLDQLIDVYLNNDDKRNEIIARGRDVVLKAHTWEARAAALLEQLPLFSGSLGN